MQRNTTSNFAIFLRRLVEPTMHAYGVISYLRSDVLDGAVEFGCPSSLVPVLVHVAGPCVYLHVPAGVFLVAVSLSLCVPRPRESAHVAVHRALGEWQRRRRRRR